MNQNTLTPNDAVWRTLDRLLPELETLYTDIHAHPELSMQEDSDGRHRRRAAARRRL